MKTLTSWRRATAIAIAGLALAAAPALANHVHTVNGVYHGLGDGANDNYYVHPFDDAGQKLQLSAWLWRSTATKPVYEWGNTCRACTHIHAYWDTSSYRECHYYSDHEAKSPGGAYNALNRNRHYHHNWCG